MSTKKQTDRTGIQDTSHGGGPFDGVGPCARAPEWKSAVGRGAFSPHFHAASELIGRRWTGAIIWALFHGNTTFGEIAHAIPGLSDRLLSERLKELSRHGIVTRTTPDGQRGRHRYELTAKGLSLRTILIEIARWAERWKAEAADGTDGQGD